VASAVVVGVVSAVGFVEGILPKFMVETDFCSVRRYC
jgi:hypothetical protein